MTIQILHGDCREVLAELPAESVQCVCTSPPYFGLRSYNGGAAEIGTEETPASYVAALVDVFRQVRRVLRPDGTVWLNLGDSYVNNPSTSEIPRSEQGNGTGAFGIYGEHQHQARKASPNKATPMIQSGLKKKDLIGIPWRVAFALQEDGWWLRSDIIWSKPNCMPESVTDRPTRSHEYIFLLTKAERYFYDADAIREPHTDTNTGRYAAQLRHGTTNGPIITTNPNPDNNTWHRSGLPGVGRTAGGWDPAGRNRRSVWTIPTAPYPGAHFATFPEKLVELMVLAGSSPQACECCGAPWRRVVEIDRTQDNRRYRDWRDSGWPTDENGKAAMTGNPIQCTNPRAPTVTTTGWSATCACSNVGSGRSVILDPFFGSGTTGKVAIKHGRDCIGIELNESYIKEQAEARTNGVQTSLVSLI